LLCSQLTLVLWGADSPTPQDSIYVHLSQESTPCKAVESFISMMMIAFITFKSSLVVY